MTAISKECEKYLKQACIFERLVFVFKDKFKNELFYNWILVFIFYTAHHYFFAFLCNKEEELPKSHNSYYNERGSVDLAIDTFTTRITKIGDEGYDSAGQEFKYLLDLSCFVRYNPVSCFVNSEEQIGIALSYLEKIKFVTFNDIGYRSGSKERNTVIIRKVSDAHLKDLYDKTRKQK